MSSYSQIYHYDGEIFDLIGMSGSGGYYHVFALKSLAMEVFIDRTPLRIGYMEFIPGQSYPRFGSNKKTSAGFVSYDGVPLRFVGTYLGHALFEEEDGPFPFETYPRCYWSWRFSLEFEVFYAVTSQSAVRQMEMDIPPSGPSKFTDPSQSEGEVSR